ncbi:MAG: 4-hydroxy-tetrahydrodipicolinate reductase [Chthonomonadaceae bacterium]|nr:4-hydroxy-tetrahydrodipicolinate reductase [Chthonomonadaceae bacterium]
MIQVAICGAAGRMGREVVKAIVEAEGMTPVGAIDVALNGEDAGTLAGVGALGVLVQSDLVAVLGESHAEVVVDFSLPAVVKANALSSISCGVSPVIGATGLSQSDLAEIDAAAKEKGIGAFVAPNFAIGAVLMMQFAQTAAKHFPDVEIIEFHHEKKLDSPSGTALLTAQRIAEAREGKSASAVTENLIEKLPGARGADYNGIPIHSVRLPGYVAHQEVIFGGLGQTLTIRHDSLDRRSFMPGVVLAVRHVREWTGLKIGLETLLF